MYEAKKQQNLQLLDILTRNSANKPSFQSPTKSFVQKIARPIIKIWYNNRVIDRNIQKCSIFLKHSMYP